MKIKEVILLLIIPIIFVFVVSNKVDEIIIENKNESFIYLAKMIAISAENKYINNNLNNIEDTIECDDLGNLGDNIKHCSIYIDNEDIRVTIQGKNKYNNMNICSDTKNNLNIVNSCDDKCFIYDVIDVVKPYEINNIDECNKFVTNNVVDLVCDNNNFNKQINQLIDNGIKEEELVKNKVIRGSITNVCIPREINETCYSFKIYTENNHKYAEITDYNDLCGNEVKIPESIVGIPVESIGEYSFHQKKVNKVIFSKSIRYIKTGSFQGHGDGINSPLKGIYLNNTLDLSNLENLEYIDYFAFADNGITKVDFPSNLNYIGSYAFSGNRIEGTLDLSNTKLNKIDGYAFSSSNITSVIFPKTIKFIGYTAFANNDIIGVLDLSQTSLEKIEEDAFVYNKINSIILPESIKTINKNAFSNNRIEGILDFSNNKNLYLIGEDSFSNNLIESIILPETIKEIGKYAFLKNEVSNTYMSEIINNTELEFNWNNIIGNNYESVEIKKEEKTTN